MIRGNFKLKCLMGSLKEKIEAAHSNDISRQEIEFLFNSLGKGNHVDEEGFCEDSIRYALAVNKKTSARVLKRLAKHKSRKIAHKSMLHSNFPTKLHAEIVIDFFNNKDFDRVRPLLRKKFISPELVKFFEEESKKDFWIFIAARSKNSEWVNGLIHSEIEKKPVLVSNLLRNPLLDKKSLMKIANIQGFEARAKTHKNWGNSSSD